MAFILPREPGTMETLQCIACAGRQEIGNSFNTEDLKKLMRQDGSHLMETHVYNNVGIEHKYMQNVKDWVTNPAKPDLLDEWLNSSVWIANSLVREGLTASYTFYRQNQFPARGKSFKDLFIYLRDKIKSDGQRDPRWFKTTAGRIYSNIDINDDKWNPADIVAVKILKRKLGKLYLLKVDF